MQANAAYFTAQAEEIAAEEEAILAADVEGVTEESHAEESNVSIEEQLPARAFVLLDEIQIVDLVTQENEEPLVKYKIVLKNACQ